MAEREKPRKRPPELRSITCWRGRSHGSLTGWKKKLLVEFSGNPPSQRPEKAVHRKVSHWSHSSAEPPEAGVGGGCKDRALENPWARQESGAGKASRAAGAGH